MRKPTYLEKRGAIDILYKAIDRIKLLPWHECWECPSLGKWGYAKPDREALDILSLAALKIQDEL